MSTAQPTLASPSPSKPTFATVALAGNPNSGKTTLFNALTGLRQKVANYPGVTVEKKVGRCRLDGDGRQIDVIDLPGTYSLVSRSPDEVVACEVLRGLRADTPAPDAVVVVVDASNLARNLYLVSQVIELGRPVLVALSMSDVAERRGIPVAAGRLERLLGVPVVPIVGHKSLGVSELKSRLGEARLARRPEFDIPAEMRAEIAKLAAAVEPIEHAQSQFVAERLIIGDRTGDLGMLAVKEPMRQLLAEAKERLAAAKIDPVQSDIEARYRWIDAITKEASGEAAAVPVSLGVTVESRPARTLNYAPRVHFTDKVDRVLIHRVWGMVVFAAVMAGLFYSVFSLAKPLMDATQGAVTWLGKLVTSHLADGALKDLINDGIFNGVGSVVVFVPQIAILFGFLAILEDSGYLARAAFLMDRLLSKVGLSGKAFIPLLSSFACAIPGIMATRTIESRKQRLATILIAPFMSCSARLPVYILLVGTFFGRWGHWAEAGVMFGCYALGIVAAAGTAWVMKRFGAIERTGGFVLELPTYKRPQVGEVARQIWVNTSKFVTRAGTVILALSVLLWAMSYYPRLPGAEAQVARRAGESAWDKEHFDYSALSPSDARSAWADRAESSAALRYSVSGRLGHLIEPLLRPLGFDWKMDIGVISAFAARETFVSTMGIVYSAGDTEESTEGLRAAMLADKYADGRPVWTLPVAVSLLVWFVLAMQCMSTMAVVRRETGGWGWPLAMLAYMNVLAYVGSLVVFQVLSRVMG